MRANCRRTKRMSVVASQAMHLGAVIMMLFAMVIVNLLASSRCKRTMDAIGAKERVLASLENDRVRENARWDALNRPERLDRALLRLGMAMHYPKQDQIIRLRADGKPVPGQLSLARLARERPNAEIASAVPSAPSARRARPSASVPVTASAGRSSRRRR